MTEATADPELVEIDETTLTFGFGRILTDDEKNTITGIVDTWMASQNEILEGWPDQHARHVDKAELAGHYAHCDPDNVRRGMTPEAATDHVDCDRGDHEPLECGDCGRGIVSHAGTQRLLVCSRLHNLPLRVEHCHVEHCVVECGGSR